MAARLPHAGQLEVSAGRGGGPKAVPFLIDQPAGGAGSSLDTAVCLLHGASGDAASGSLPALAAACADAGLPCLRITCRGGSLDHRVAVTKAFLSQAGTLPGLANVTRWVLAGHSMGARVAASIASDPDWRQQTVAAILSSYPLHPPRRPQELRDALLHALQLPTLLVRGVRDPFSQQALWDAALEGMQGACAWRQHTVLGGDHGLRISGTGGAAKSQEALEGVCAAVQDFIREVQQEQQQPQQAAAAVAAAAAGGGRRSYSRTASQPRVARGSQQTKRRSSDGGGRGPGSKRQRR